MRFAIELAIAAALGVKVGLVFVVWARRRERQLRATSPCRWCDGTGINRTPGYP